MITVPAEKLAAAVNKFLVPGLLRSISKQTNLTEGTKSEFKVSEQLYSASKEA